MALLKKTVVLTNNGAEGYITVVRVGDEVGAKVVGSAFEKGMLAAIKIGTEPVFYAKLDGERTEISLNVSFNQNDDISCIIIQNDMLIARAGRNLSKRELAQYFISREADNIAQQEAQQEAQEVSNVQEVPDTQSMATTPVEPEITIIKEVVDEAMTTKRPNGKRTAQANTRPKAQPKAEKPTMEKPKTEKPKAENLQELNIVAPTVEPKADKKPMADSIDSDTEKEFLSRLHATGSKNFYQNVKERLDDLFVIHPRENELERIIPESQWVKIRYDGDDYYVVGSLEDDGTVSYLAYGVPGVAEIPPPKLASDISDWLPVPNLPPPYQGYWLIFQNADDGKVGNIK